MRAENRDRGSVTAELAIVMPALIGLLAMLLVAAAAGMGQLRAQEGARAGARAAARGDEPAAIERIVHHVSGADATVTVSADGPWVAVRVTTAVRGPIGSWISWPVTAVATARAEPSSSVGAPGSDQPWTDWP